MDAQISVLMANQAKAKAGDLVFDPFVGTGQIYGTTSFALNVIISYME